MSRRSKLIRKRFAQMNQVRMDRKSAPDQPRKPMQVTHQPTPWYTDNADGRKHARNAIQSMYPNMYGYNMTRHAEALIRKTK